MANSYDRFYIGGEWVPPGGGDLLEVISPVTQEVIATVPDAVNADMDAAVAAARDAFHRGVWPLLSPDERAAHVEKFAQAYLARCPEMSSLITEQMGCPISFSSQIQAPPAGGMLQYFTGLAGSYPWEERRAGIIGGDILVCREPVGVVGVIAPWNVPQLVIMSRVRPSPHRRMHGGDQTGPRDPTRHPSSGRDRGRGRPSPRCHQCRARGPRGGGAPRSKCRRRQDRLHWVDGGG